MRNFWLSPRRNKLGFRFFIVLLLVLVISVFRISDFARGAAGDVTLTGSAFSDTDAEDTMNASQWVVRDASVTVYDQVAGAVTTITVPAATFVNGTTYFWKVRYQDQHLVWSDYSAESSFVYGSGATPTPAASTAAPSSTATPSSIVSGTATVTPNPSPSPAPTWSCMFGWTFINGGWFCGDPQAYSTSILVPEDQNDFCPQDMVKITYYYHYGQQVSGGWGLKTLEEYQDLAAKKDSSGELDSPVHDIYLSTDGGSVYNRIEHDFDPMPGAVMEKVPSPSKGRTYPYAESVNYLKVTHYVKIPQGTISDPSKAKLLVYVAANRHPINYSGLPEGTAYIPIGGDDLGDSFLFSSEGNNYWKSADGDVMDYSNGVQAKQCTGMSITPTTSGLCKSTITSPKNWVKGSTNRIAWASGFASNPNDQKTVNILAEKSSSTEPIAMTQPDVGSYVANYDPGNVRSFNLKLEQYVSGKLASSCSVNLKVSSGDGSCSGVGCLPQKVDKILVLGSLIATLLGALLSLLAAFPAFSRVLSGLFNLMSAPVWGMGGPSGKHAWGIVYDTSTKTPIEKAVIRVFSAPSDRLRATIRTNKNGQFGFILPPGNYSLTGSASGFDFPTRLITASTDGPYANLYRGGAFQVDGDGTEKAQINFNVPLDRVKVTTFDLVELKTLTAVSRFFQAIRIPLMILGTLSTGYLVFTQGRTFDYVLAVVYALMWGWEIKNMLKKKAFGVVKDQRGNPISLVVIRVLDKYNRLKTTIVTGDDGKFQANLDPGEYRLDISRPGYKSVRTQLIKISNVQDIGKLDINLTKL